VGELILPEVEVRDMPDRLERCRDVDALGQVTARRGHNYETSGGPSQSFFAHDDETLHPTRSRFRASLKLWGALRWSQPWTLRNREQGDSSDGANQKMCWK